MIYKNANNPAGLNTKKRLSFLLRDSALYGGAAAFSKSFALITLPILARHFSVTEYGLIDLFTVVAGLLGVFFVFGQDSAVARFFYEYEDTNTRRQLISQSLIYQLAVVLFIIPIAWIISDSIAPSFSNADESKVLFKLVLLQVPFLVLINSSKNLLKWTFSRSLFLTMSIGFVTTKVIVLLIAVLFYDIGVKDVLLLTLIVVALFGVLGLLFIRSWLILPSTTTYLGRLIKFATPLGIICVIGAFVPVLERSLVSSLVGSHELGLYAAGSKIALASMLIVGAFQTAWGPFSLAIYKQSDAITTYNWVLKGFTVLMCVMVLLLTAFANPLIVFLATDKFAGASIVVFPLAMGVVIKAISWITEIGIGISKKSYLNLYSYLVFISLTILGIFVLASSFGMLGVATGVMFGHIGQSITATLLAQRVYPLPWRFKPVIIVILVTLVIGLVGVYLNNFLSTTALTIFYSAGALIIAILSWQLLFEQNDRRRIIQLLRTGKLNSLTSFTKKKSTNETRS